MYSILPMTSNGPRPPGWCLSVCVLWCALVDLARYLRKNLSLSWPWCCYCLSFGSSSLYSLCHSSQSSETGNKLFHSSCSLHHFNHLYTSAWQKPDPDSLARLGLGLWKVARNLHGTPWTPPIPVGRPPLETYQKIILVQHTFTHAMIAYTHMSWHEGCCPSFEWRQLLQICACT